ncbi:hypothetical protein [Rhizobium halophytocola]|uniref:DUF2946 domain-containing protein n=1 Tax=Rhizobium halophytocola TaxID=735519 RepID=A0ABS4DZL5_9HYPH|nr:hypothetical protein [Rhizobium halophytocola]MBP1851089.1 hypothetical protein [Rhizobium halophytocola]
MANGLNDWKAWLRLVCAVALLSLGFAHRPPQLLAAIIETASLQLPDGSYADLCLGEKGTHIPGVPAGACEACMLGGQTCLPAPADDGFLIRHFVALANPLVSEAVADNATAIGQPRSRGPPSLS